MLVLSCASLRVSACQCVSVYARVHSVHAREHARFPSMISRRRVIDCVILSLRRGRAVIGLSAVVAACVSVL